MLRSGVAFVGLCVCTALDFRGLHHGRFDGKVCFITGGTSGIGEHAAYHLAQEGCAVAFSGRRVERGKEVLATIEAMAGKSKLSPSALFLKMDVTKSDEVEAGVAQINSTYGRLDAVFVNAGGDPPEPTFSAYIDLNLNSAFYTIKSSADLMREGSMVLCTSLMGQQVLLLAPPGYVAAKHGMEGLRKSFALSLAPKIRVNSVGASFTSSDTVDRYMAMPPFSDFVMEHQVGNRLVEKGEVSSTVAWLLSDDSSYVSGQAILVDGGALNTFSSLSRQEKLQRDLAAYMAAGDAKEPAAEL